MWSPASTLGPVIFPAWCPFPSEVSSYADSERNWMLAGPRRGDGVRLRRLGQVRRYSL